MDIRTLAPELGVAPQVRPEDVAAIARAGYRAIICNRPDGEGPDQPVFAEIERAANEHGLAARYLPAESGKVSDEQGQRFGQMLEDLPRPVLAYCRTGMRSTTMWALAQAKRRPLADILQRAAAAGYDLKGVLRRIANGGKTPVEVAEASHAVVIIGGGAAGVATAASLLKRRPGLDVAIVDPADVHYYQPGWTLVGAGVFDPRGTARTMGSVLPRAVDGPARHATFALNAPDGKRQRVTREFDLLHVVPPQKAPDFVRASPLADAAGWVDVDPATLRHRRYANVFALGDAGAMPNAKTAAAARKQAPVVAHNVLATRGDAQGEARYDGYGSCPLTVENGKIVLAEFLYGGKVAPSFPKWLVDGTRPSRLAWYLKERILPPLYWQGMLKGHEWMVQPELAD